MHEPRLVRLERLEAQITLICEVEMCGLHVMPHVTLDYRAIITVRTLVTLSRTETHHLGRHQLFIICPCNTLQYTGHSHVFSFYEGELCDFSGSYEWRRI